MPIARPDTNTLFHIDTEWFENNGRELRSEMHDALCDECRTYYPTPADSRPVDRIHPQTGEVSKVDALWECIADHCGLRPGFITPATPLTTGIFRALLSNGNNPMSPEQLHKRVVKSNPSGILKLLMGAEIENGVVPAQGNNKSK
ncbi:MAG: hypothetical protein HY782_16955 [Chloroflexi bacterium]|nr:hypothetical protein [Chloroflexota bacterium]